MRSIKERGNKGEAFAENILKSKGYEILHKNFNTKLGEIDIIAEKNGRITFVEVKARSSEDFASPREFVTLSKQRKIVNTACIYLKKNNINKPVSFDVIEIVYTSDFKEVIKSNHIENAFYSRR